MDVQAIACKLSTDIGPISEISPIADNLFTDQILDTTQKFILRRVGGPDLFLIVSGRGNRTLVRRSVDNIRAVREAVSPHVSGPVLEPVIAGEEMGCSYAVWPRKRPFAYSNRLAWFFARKRFSDPILNWSEALTCETLTAGDPNSVILDLRKIQEDVTFPLVMRRDALHAEERMRYGAWRPMNCFQHGDFWTGNILLGNEKRTPSFFVIDWGGMQQDGYPFYDLIRMLLSLHAARRVTTRRLERLRTHLGCAAEDVTSYALSALGSIGRNLEYFPHDLYRTMAIAVYELVNPKVESKCVSSHVGGTFIRAATNSTPPLASPHSVEDKALSR